MSDKEKILERMVELNDELKLHSQRYYQENNPTIQDSEWDKNMKELKKLEQANPDLIIEDSVTQSVGFNPSSGFKTKVHSTKMLSLGNIFDGEGLENFIEKVNNHLETSQKNPEFSIEPKYDGVAVAITYKKGKLTSAITRGNGFEGEDITSQMHKVENLITELPFSAQSIPVVEVRGELVMSRSDLNYYNEKAASAGAPILANCRNAAAGTLRQTTDTNSIAPRPLYFIVYTVVTGYPDTVKTQSDALQWISKFEFQTATSEVYTSIDDINDAYLRHHAARPASKFDVDGMVIKVNDLALQDIISTTSREPKWAIAYKFPADLATSKILKVTWQLSRLGQLTPVANIAEVQLNDVSINNVTLHNHLEIERLDLHLGDTVNVIRSGDVIPKITGVIKRLRPDNATRVLPPKYCPSCDSKVIMKEGDPAIYCSNPLECKDVLTATFLHFTSKEAMDIKGFGEKIVETLVKDGYLRWFADIYYLHRHRKQLYTIGGLGEKSVDNLLDAIEESKERPLSRLIYGLGIPFVGIKTAQTLAGHFITLTSLRESKPEDFIDLPGVGLGVSEAVLEYVNNPNRKIELDALEMSGISPQKGV